MPHPLEGGTALHVAAWKAPPALFVKMIRLLPRDAREISVLMGIRDGEGVYSNIVMGIFSILRLCLLT